MCDTIHNSGNTGSEVWTSEGFFDSENYGGGSPLHSAIDLDGDGSYELVNHTWENMNFFNIDVQGADSYNILEPDQMLVFIRLNFLIMSPWVAQWLILTAMVTMNVFFLLLVLR